MTSNKRQKLSMALSLEPTSTSTLTSQNGHHSIEQPVRTTLSERLKNLWDQRGDFSDFNADKLRLKPKSQQQDHDDDKQERVAENQGSGDKRQSSFNKTKFDFQIPQDEESESESNGKGKGKEKEQQTSEESTDKQDPKSSSNDPSSRDTITSNEMFNLRTEMMNHLSQAHYDIFYLSSLLTYVSNFTKPVLSQPQPNTHTNNLALPSRAASPSTSSVGRRNNQARTTGTGGGSGSVNDQSQHFQSQTPAEELGLDPHSIGLSLVMNESKARRDNKQEEDEDDDDEEEEFLEPLDIKNLSIKERIRENSLLISEKRNSLVNSIDILRNGARSINPLAFVDEDQYQQEEEVKASNDGLNSEMERFEILKKLKSNGWGINPSKAQLPKNVFGMSLEVGGQAVNNEDGGGLNGARDCLIGWGVPEALSHFRTQSFAYIGSSASKEPLSSSSSELIFPRRQYRRLRVVFVVNRSEIIDGKEESIEERYGSFIPDIDDQNHVETKEVVKESDRDVEMRDPSSSNVDQEKVEEKQEKVDLDSELKKAQKEMMDEELFSELVGQYRRIERRFGLDDDFFGIDDKLIPSSNQQKNLGGGGGDSFKPKTKLSLNHLSISLNSKVELRFEMVPTTTSDDSKKKKKNLDELTDIKKEHYHFSHVASLIRGYFEMEIIRRYRSKAGIDSTTTISSSSDGQKTNNWKGGKKTLEDERKSKEGNSLQCLIMIVRYFTFVNQLEALLSKIVSDQNSTSKAQSQSKIELSWNPISNITDLGKWIEQLMLGQTDNESQSGLIGIVESLGGNASLWRRNKPMATLTFSSSLNLSLQLPQPFTPGSNVEEEDSGAKEKPGSRQKNQLPRDGKGRIINGLNLKQLELFLKNALMES